MVMVQLQQLQVPAGQRLLIQKIGWDEKSTDGKTAIAGKLSNRYEIY
ncbi:MAG: hypothetical protein HC820_02575 [Hydrococcus sp. RM1_1_31]|nr:hypothetical protein [Hydrococcus sp. RM1_1_31]